MLARVSPSRKMLSFLSPCPLMGITTRCCHTETGLRGLCSKTSLYVISHSSSKMDGVCQTQASLSWTTSSDGDSLIVRGKIIFVIDQDLPVDQGHFFSPLLCMAVASQCWAMCILRWPTLMPPGVSPYLILRCTMRHSLLSDIVPLGGSYCVQ